MYACMYVCVFGAGTNMAFPGKRFPSGSDQFCVLCVLLALLPDIAVLTLETSSKRVQSGGFVCVSIRFQKGIQR